jgi:hypothetical protein
MFKYSIKKQNSIKYYYERKDWKNSLMSLISNHRQDIELGCPKLDKIKYNTYWKLRSQILQFQNRFEKKAITFVHQLK